MPLWCKDYFQLQATENQPTEEEFFALSLSTKVGHTFPSEKGARPVPEQMTLIIKNEMLTPGLVCTNRTY